MQHILRFKKALRQSSLTVHAEQQVARKPAFSRMRSLNAEEISVLQKQGNHCTDWSLVLVENGFSPERIVGCIFHGKITLPNFFGTVLTPGGISLPTGLYRSTLADCQLENCHIQDVSLLAGAIVCQGAVLQNVGSLVSSGQTTFGLPKQIPLGNETGGRPVWIFPEITQELVDMQLFTHKDRELHEALAEIMNSWSDEISQVQVFIGKGATICNTNIVRNSWIGPHVRIDGAAKIRNSVILSTLENPCELYDGIILEGSSVQAGCKIHSFCHIRNSVLMQNSRVGRKAMINQSVIGPLCHLEAVEITSSYCGPLVQAHHHSLLIAAIWPGGRGNLGYGANVGSNHTGRLPDQEIHPGTGLFFGLGCNIKFPANFSEAPWSLIATGVTTQPQRVRFPFSLIRQPGIVPAGINPLLNEIHPLWGYGHNAFAMERNLYKFSTRGRPLLDNESNHLLEPDLARLILEAHGRLRSVSKILEFYTEVHIPGIGSNFMRESTRQDALDICLSYLERYAVHMALVHLENGPPPTQDGPSEIRKLFQGDLLRDIYRILKDLPSTIPALVRRHRTLEKRWMENVLRGQDTDFSRGRQIFDDYDSVHPVDNDLRAWIQTRFEHCKTRCNHLLKSLRPQKLP